MPELKSLTVRLTDSQKARLKEVADNAGLSCAEYAREIIGKAAGFDPDEVRSRGRQPGFHQAEWWLNPQPVLDAMWATDTVEPGKGPWVANGDPRQTCWGDIAVRDGDRRFIRRARWHGDAKRWFIGDGRTNAVPAEWPIVAWRPVDDCKWVYPVG